MKKFPRILAVGGAHIDRRGQLSIDFVPGASNPGSMREDVGGGVFNAARCAASRGAAVSLFSVRGGDAAGATVARAMAEAGIADLSAVFLDRATPSYTAILDRHGDVIAALADMGLYDLAFPKQLRRSKLREAVETSDAVFCDANLPASALALLCDAAAGRPIFAIGISPAKVVRLAGVASRLAWLFVNRREAATLAGADADPAIEELVPPLRRLGLECGVITQGNGPAIGFDASRIVSLTPPAARRIADVTGAGDAMAGITAVALLRGLPLDEAMREGMAAAMLAIESSASVPEYSPQDFAAALALVPTARHMR